MTSLVFLDPNKIDAIPFTTSDVVAEFAGIQHHAVQQIISKRESDFKEFGVIAFEMRKPRAIGKSELATQKGSGNVKLVLNPEYGLYEKDGKVLCDSLQVADTFEKRHDNVIRDIEALDCSKQFWLLNFEESDYKARGKKYPRYLITKDGFTFLVMGYRGRKAAAFKEAYITRFNEMEAFIKSLQTAKLEFPAFTTAIMEAHEEPKHYHFSNEINMINRIVLGVDAKHFKESNGLDKNISSIRPYLDVAQIEAIESLQRVDIGLIVAGLDFNTRKQLLTTTYAKRRCPAALTA